IGYQKTRSAPKKETNEISNEISCQTATSRSVAIANFCIVVFMSSWLALADRLLIGVVAGLPFSESAGVEPVVVTVLPWVLLFALRAAFAAFSAKRLCFEADGVDAGIVKREEKEGSEC